MAAKITALHACECSTWIFNIGEPESDQDYGTGCQAQTVRIFAQGHDAKLAGFLVRADMGGEEISKTDGGMLMTYPGAVEAAATISEAFAFKVQTMMIQRKSKAQKKAEKAPRKAAKTTEAPAPAESTPAAPEVAETAPAVELAPIEARIKVGRWTYDAQIDRTDRTATYATKLGGTKTAADGTYTVL